MPTNQGFELGVVPTDPVNAFRSGEKTVFDGTLPKDIDVSVTIDLLGQTDARDAGLLIRTSGPSVGYDSQRGYFAGLIPKTGLAIFGKTDGKLLFLDSGAHASPISSLAFAPDG